MTEDFTTRLRLQLRDAALREEQRGALARGLLSARPRPAMALGAVAAALALALVAVTTLLVGSRREEPAAPPGPRVVADVPIADALGGSAATGFGSVWMSESQDGQILRVDPRTRRVTARIAAGSEVSVAAGDGAVWAVRRGSLGRPILRIDPRTNRVVARIPQRSPAGDTFGGVFVTVVASRVWVLSGSGALLIDPATNRVVREVRLGGSFFVVDALVRGGELWLIRANDTITRFDARTGRRIAQVPWTTRGGLFPFADRLIAANRRSVEFVDPTTGRASWRARLGTELHAFMVVGPRVFVEGADGPTERERIWQLDARTGRVAGAVTMPQFGLVGIVPVGDGVWMLTSNGHAVVVSP
jgi:DNA-binding beta-propeller fold protein YncE